MTRNELLRKIILTEHLNVLERAELTPAYIRISEVIDIIAEELHSHRVFPILACPSQQGEAIYEGPYIVKGDSGEFVLHFQRHSAISPAILAEHCLKQYDSITEVIRAYIAAEWGDYIDGISLVEG